MAAMKVKLRHIDEAESLDFTEVHFTELPALIDFIERAGGVYMDGATQPFHSYQLAVEGEAYAEILIGKEPSAAS